MKEVDTRDLDVRDMTALARGHDAALNHLMERHGGKLFHYLLRSLQSEEDAADLAQETFVRVFQNRQSYDPRQRFVTWLYAIASNLVRDRYRWRARHPNVPLESNDGEGETGPGTKLISPTASPDEALETKETADAVRSAVAALPEELRQPLILAVYEEFSHLEIGQILGCSPKAVEMRVYRARQQLKQVLEQRLSVDS
jgi:RNA polymerase sigma-70 factor (ECF subfamily)